MKNINFKEYKLEESIQKSLSILKYEYLTPVQKQAIPMALKNKDIIVKSQTGERVIIVTGCINVLVSRVSGTLTKYNSCIA